MSVRNIPVLILNWNGWPDTIQCVCSVNENAPHPEIWVIENGSTEDQSKIVLDKFPDTRIIRLDRNYGWSGGYNRALQIALDEGYQFAYLLNNDTVVQPGFLEKVATVASQSPDIAAVGSTMLFEGGEFVRFDGKYFSPGEKSAEKIERIPAEIDVPRVNGGGMLIRLDAFSRVGPFDERFFCYGEEEDWCDRAREQNGLRLKVARESFIEHRCGGSDISANSHYYRVRNTFLNSGPSHPDILTHARRQFWRIYCQRNDSPREVVRAMLCGVEDGMNRVFGPRNLRTPTLRSRCVLWAHTSFRFGQRMVGLAYSRVPR